MSLMFGNRNMRRSFETSRVFATFRFLCFVVLVTFLPFHIASADTVDSNDPSGKASRFISEYVRIAFGADRPVLRKLAMPLPIGAAYHCEGIDVETCNSATNAMQDAIHINDNLKFDFNKTPAIVELIFSSNELLEKKTDEAMNDFAGGFMDVSDSECELFSQAENSSIKRIRLIFSASQPPLKLKICIAYQLAQALGLNPFGGVPFASQWKNGSGGLSVATDAVFETAVRELSAMEYIHMCPELHPAMTSEQVIADLSASDSCITKLIPYMK